MAVVEDMTDRFLEGRDRWGVPARDDEEQRLRTAGGGPQQVVTQSDAEVVGPLDIVEREEGRPHSAHRLRGSLEDADRLDG